MFEGFEKYPLTKEDLIDTLLCMKARPDLSLREAKAISQSIETIYKLDNVLKSLNKGKK